MGDQYDEQALDLIGDIEGRTTRAAFDVAVSNVAAALRAVADGARRQAAHDALGYATRLAEALMAKHYPEASQWRVLPDLLGVLTQIDNMTTGFVRAAPPQPDHASGKQEAFGRMLDGCIAFLMERGHEELATEMRARIMEHPEVQPDPVAAAREAVVRAAMARWRSEATREPAYWEQPSAETTAQNEACAALAALERSND